MTECPCCSNQMIRHIGHHQVYWFCRHCWQEMPVFDLNKWDSSSPATLVASVGIKKQFSFLRIG
ncbi:MAG TPA: hypothetical protein V6D28_16275 [Leptolyngbyaceae cyanobacterium]